MRGTIPLLPHTCSWRDAKAHSRKCGGTLGIYFEAVDYSGFEPRAFRTLITQQNVGVRSL